MEQSAFDIALKNKTLKALKKVPAVLVKPDFFFKTILLLLLIIGSSTLNAQLSASFSAQTNVLCHGDATGSLTALASTGTANYTYNWSNGSNTVNVASTTNTISGLVAGDYTVTITDNNLPTPDTSIVTATITEPTAALGLFLNTVFIVDNVDCNGGSNGEATVIAQTGTPPYTYLWSNTHTTDNPTGLSAGTYTVTVTDNNGCTVTGSNTITQPASPLVASATTDNDVSCNGLSDGQGTASGTGGTTPYTYFWNTTATTATVSTFSAATYYVTITDANGCTDSARTTITEPAALVASATTDNDVSCNGLSDGGGTASQTGGTAPYTYFWNTTAATPSITAQPAATYYVTITDANGCTDSARTTIIEPGTLVASVSPTNISCNGLTDGQGIASETGGTAPYTYFWNTGETNASETAIGVGTYYVTITDANGCTDSARTTITEPAALVASATTDNDVSCNGLSDGQGTASQTGGTAPYTYFWNTTATSATVSTFAAATYYVTITDANGCTDSARTTITEPAAIVASATTDNDVSCNGLSDGQGTASQTGGTAPYTYFWNTTATSATVSTFAAATYYVTITDANGCTDSARTTITEPAALVASAATDNNASCNGVADGQGTASETGGTAPYTYFWNTGEANATETNIGAGTYYVTITDANGCTDSARTTITESAVLVASATTDNDVSCNGLSDGQGTASETGGTGPYTYSWNTGETNATETNIGAGTYYVTITDANGCTDSARTTITEPTALVVTVAIDSNVTCNGFSDGGLSISTTGGTGTYTYLWSNAEITTDITGLTAGTYTITVTDANGCTDTDMSTITEPANFAAFNNSSTPACVGSTISFTDASTGAINWRWDFGDGDTSIMQNPTHIYPLDTGSYDVTLIVGNATGCFDTLTKANLITIQSPVADFTLNPSIGCATPHAVFFTDQSTLPDTWLWNFGDGNTSTLQNPVHNYTTTGLFTVSLTVTDTVNGCSDIHTDTVNVSTITADFDEGGNSFVFGCAPLIANFNDNSIASGSSIASWSWDFGDGGTSTSQNPSYTYNTPGIYSVSLTVTDTNGCSTTETKAAFTQAIGPDVNFGSDTSLGCIPFTVNFTDSTVFGAPITSWTWDFGDGNTSNLQNPTHTYTVSDTFDVSLTITDIDGCSRALSLNNFITTSGLIATIVLDSSATCSGNTDGGVTAVASAGVGPYTYNWSNGGNDSSITGIADGTYTVTITDVSGCTNTDMLVIMVVDTIRPTVVTNDTTIYLDGSGIASVTAAGIDNGSSDACGIASMSLDSTSFDCSEVGANTVTLRVTDVNGNIDSATATITVLDTIRPTVIANDTTIYLDVNGMGSVTAAGIDNGSNDVCGIASMSIDSTNFDCSEVGANTVSFKVTDVNGNVDSTTVTVTVLDTIRPTVIANDTTIYLDVNGTGSVTAAGIDNGSSDNCSISVMSLDSTNFDCSETGVNVVTFKVTDINGNVDSTTATVTVLDTIKPLISACPIDITATNDAGVCGAVVTWVTPLESDNCQVDSLVSNFNSGDLFPIGVTEVIYVAYDPSMNTDTCRFTITVTDNEDPVLANVPADIAVSNDIGNCDAIVTWTAPTASDNCTIDSTRSNFSPGSAFPVGTTTVEYITYDSDLNTDTVSFTITVNDTELPTLTCPADTVLCSPVYTFTAPVGADNCGVVSTVQTEGIASGGTYPVGPTTNKFVVTDVNGNIDSCSFIVTISENPVVNAGPDQSVFEDDGVKLEAIVDSIIGTTYLWESPLSTADIQDPMTPDGKTTAFPDEDTEFSILVTTSLGCEGRDTIKVFVNKTLVVPTAFTPNNDLINDTWDIKNIQDFAEVEVLVVNGLGTELLSTTDYKPWDGKYEGTDLSVGTYYYVIKIKEQNGNEIIKTGIVTILR